MPRIKRVRQHVNPLSSKYGVPTEPPCWDEVFDNARLPLHLDIGCAKGDFVRGMAALQSERNFLGLEIREPLVVRSLLRHQQAVARGAHRNLHFIFCNANNSLKPILDSYPGALDCVSIQFPDPWFKKRHQKRRVVQPELVDTLADAMPAGAKIWLQSDIEDVCIAMCDRFDEHPKFIRQTNRQPNRQPNQWLTESPFPAKTDREIVTEEKHLPIYRAMYLRAH